MHTHVKRANGQPRFFLNDAPVPMTFVSPNVCCIADMVPTGVTIWDTHPFTPLGWVGDDTYNYHNTDCYIERHLACNPKALLILRAWPGYCYNRIADPSLTTLLKQRLPTGWDATLREDGWGDAHPDECEQGEAGTCLDWPAYKPHSMASALYRRHAAEAIERWTRHVEENYGDRIFGYVIGGGPCGEWFMWSCYYSDPAYTGDYSPAMLHYFRAWLTQKYGTDAALRQAWACADVTRASACVPSCAERCDTGTLSVRLPSHGRRVIDYGECLSDALADTLLAWTAAAKRGTQRHKVIGTFYGYTFTVTGAYSVRRAQGRMQRVLGSADVDFIIAPSHYDNRMLGGVHGTQVPAATVTAHGKVYLDEIDTSTHLAGKFRKATAAVLATTPGESVQLLRRDWACNFINGHAMWFMDLGGGWYCDPALQTFVRQAHAIDARCCTRPAARRVDIAVVVDDRLFHYLAENSPLLSPVFLYQVLFELGYVGAPYDAYLLSDICALPVPDYRFYLFLSPVVMDAAQVAAIHQRLARNGATVLWTVWPGFIRDGDADPAHTANLISMRVEARHDAVPALVTLLEHAVVPRHLWHTEYGYDPDHDLRLGCVADAVVITNAPRDKHFFSPQLVVTDAAAQRLGVTRSGDVGFALKQQPGWTSVFSMAPAVPCGVLRMLARQAGVHIYSDQDDVVYANESFVALHATTSGPRILTLPQPRTVVDAFSGAVLGTGTRQITLASDKYQTHILELQ